ncbi:MAG TPA: CHAT domain-containing protein [Blastocatellia bacterium]|nr:CHAT domain-containing protein [Blastocatellia bacterium]
MIPKAEDEKLIRRYLLGALTEDERRRLETRVFDDGEFASRFPEHLSLLEDELIEDYVKGALTRWEKKRFEDHFLRAPQRREKLSFIESLSNYATGVANDSHDTDRKPASHLYRWVALVFTPAWKYAGCAVLIFGIVIVIWRSFFYTSDIDKGLSALSQAYRDQRPLAARITGFGYAPYPDTRGDDDKDAKVDYRAREYSELLLRREAAERPTAAALYALGKYYLTQKRFSSAIDQFEAALKTDPDNPRLHSDLGTALFEKGKSDRQNDQFGAAEVTLARSRDHLSRALELDDSLLDALFNRALLHQTMNLREQAKKDWESYLSKDPTSAWAEEAKENLKSLDAKNKASLQRRELLFQDFNNAYQAGDGEAAWRAYSASHFREGNYVTGRLIDEFLELSRKGNKGEAASRIAVLEYAGELSERKVGDRFTATLARLYKLAPPDHRAALARAREMIREAISQYDRTEIEQAIKSFTQARAPFESAGDLGEALQADFWIGHCYDLQEDAQRSVSILSGLVGVCGEKGFLWLHAAALHGLSIAYTALSESSMAINCSSRSQELSKQLEDKNGELRSTNMLAYLYREVGRNRESLRLARRGLELADAISAGNSQRAGFYSTSAWNFSALGMYPTALAFQQEAVRLAEETNNPLSMSRYYIHLGLIYRKLNDYGEATRQVRLGLEIGQKSPQSETGRNMIYYALLNLGHIYRETGALDKALEAYEEVIKYGKEKNSEWMLYTAYKGRLLTYVNMRDLRAADEEIRNVLKLFDEHRRKILEDSNRSSFFDSEQDIYDLAVDFAYTELQSKQKAFEYSEMSRARSLLDSVRGGRRRVVDAAIELRLTEVSSPVGLEEVQRRMPDQAQILQYAALEDKLIVWLISKDRVESRSVGVKLKDLESLVSSYLEQVSSQPKNNDVEIPESAKTLYELLIQPLESSFDGHKSLCIVPDKSLNSLPFAALYSRQSNKYLIEKYRIFYSPSSSMFLVCSDEARRKAGDRQESLLSVGNPSFNQADFPEMHSLGDLPNAADEAFEIAKYYDRRHLFVKEDARKNIVMKGLEKADVAHLAMHHLPDPQSPLHSKLVLATETAPAGSGRHRQENTLSAYELYSLNLSRTRLVVLSACQTRAGEYLQREGSAGISRSFEAVGVPLVVASLWKVDSPATKDLMINFHQNRKRVCLPTAEALKQAQLSMLNDTRSRRRHPYYWASFVATGGYSEF